MALKFTDEQRDFLSYARDGKDVLVDACIGSGKTTAIQAACDVLNKNSRILYLTYNRRLLEEARKRINNTNVMVHTFHSFAGQMLTQADLGAGSERDVIPEFIKHMKRVYRFDTVIVDEYQDLSEDLKDMLWHICRMSYNNYQFCPQFLIVGDRDQKISDNTNVDAVKSIHELLSFLDSIHKDSHVEMQFTNCFRLSADYASKIGQAWNKSIVGLNDNCKISYLDVNSTARFLSQFNPEDILVLGNNMSWGARVEIQNILENKWPEKFNRDTVYSSITDRDADRRNIDASKCAIFTTFDASKGLERKVCVVCNFDSGYLESRMKHQTARQVLKNLFLVAASRGKEFNVFCGNGRSDTLSFDDIGRISGTVPVDMRPVYMSDLYDYKTKEDVDACIECLNIETIQKPFDELDIKTKIGQIDISMCQGIYAQASYFQNYDIESAITVSWNERIAKGNFPKLPAYNKSWPLWKKILFLTALETGHERYVKQITENYISAEEEQALKTRLSSVFDEFSITERTVTIVYKDCKLTNNYVLGDRLLRGRVDVIKDDIPWELKFTANLKAEHALQAALYAIAMNTEYSMLYNIRTNEIQKITIPDRALFLTRTLDCITRHVLKSDMACVSKDIIAL